MAGKTSADYVYFCVAVLEDFGESKRRSSSVEARVDQNLRSRLLKDMLPRYLKRCGVETLCKDIWKSNLWVSLFFFFKFGSMFHAFFNLKSGMRDREKKRGGGGGVTT